MTGALERAAWHAWTGRTPSARALRAALAPAALAYGAVAALRNRLYDAGWLDAARVPAHVVSVGNLAVGGTGKTPTALWLAERLAARGWRVGIVARGYRAVFEPHAVGVEPSTGDFWREFRRKRRIVNRSWHGVMSVPAVLDPRRVGLFAWQVWSHKVLRWLLLPALIVTAAGCILASPRGSMYQAGVWLFAATLVLAGLGAVTPGRVGRIARLVHGAFYFYLVNVAATLGIAMAVCGRVETVWRSERA